jgi:mevalonate kinase
VRLVQHHLALPVLPPLILTLRSAIPIAGGLGSGAALAACLIRALLRHLGAAGDDATVCRLTWEVEKVYHGTPSGIDNTVVAYEQPVWFVQATPDNVIEPFEIGRNLTLLIGDTGVRSATRAVVDDVRHQWQADPDRFGALFAECGTIAHAARAALQAGDAATLGRLMTHNHTVLQALTVSSPELDRLVQAALAAGAIGAKLSGAGRGGNMLALLPHPESAETVTRALLTAGAHTILTTTLTAEASTPTPIPTPHASLH